MAHTKIIERTHVSPPQGSVPETTLPLTFFDIPWLLCRHMQRLFFFQYPHSTLHFMESTLPSLKSSLSLTLQTFFPLAAELCCPPPPQKPHFVYSEGASVAFTIAESSADFNGFIGYHAQEATALHPFVPRLPPTRVSNEARLAPLLAIQVTLFPNSGICVAATFAHVAADGRSFNHFMKSWASVSRSGQNLTRPVFVRDEIKTKDPCGLESIFLKEWWNWASNWEEDKSPIQEMISNKVRSTFILGRAHIERLKNWVFRSYMNQDQLHVSTFVVTCALAWTCLMKCQRSKKNQNQDDLCYFCFVGDCRNRDEFGISATYFGDCLAICFVAVKLSALLAEDGVLAAAKAIGQRVREFENGALRGAENWMNDWKEKSETGRVVTVAGSPKLGVYETDFGWGRPRKSEVAQIDASSCIYIGDCRDEEGGVEIGLALTKSEMEAFGSFYEEALKSTM